MPDTGAAWYYWRLPEPTFWSRFTAWGFYIAHQVVNWILIYYAQSRGLKYSNRLHGVIEHLQLDAGGERAELTLAIAASRHVLAIIDPAMIAALGLQAGVAAWAQFEPAAVILAVGD